MATDVWYYATRISMIQISYSIFVHKSSFIIIEYSREIYFPSTEIPSINGWNESQPQVP